MKKTFFTLLICNLSLLGSEVVQETWQKNQTFLGFLEEHHIPASLYYGLNEDDQTLVASIYQDTEYHLLTDDNGSLRQALIPIGEDLQISLNREEAGYKVEILPVEYTEQEETVTFALEHSLMYDLKKITGNSKLAMEVMSIFNDRVDFRTDFRKGDRICVIFNRKVRLGKTWGAPDVVAAFVETRGRKNYAFYNDDDQSYYDEKAKPLQGMFLRHPLNYSRISSRFTYKRWHPILKKYRPHYGVDYVAPYGSKIWTVADGRVAYVGKKGGYGKIVIVQHKNGYRSEYAHLKGFPRGIRKGRYVKQGQTVGYLGNTGLSTGPHLHFGLWKSRSPVNPSKIKGIKKEGLQGEARKSFMARADQYVTDLAYMAETATGKVVRVADLHREEPAPVQ